MRKDLWFILFLSITTFVSGQGPWTKKADFSGETRGKAVGFCISNKCYVGTGGDYGYGSLGYKDLWEWDSFTETWTQKADLPGGPRTGAVGFSIGHRGYITGGFNYLSTYNDLWEYDPLTDLWTQRASLPISSAIYSAAFVISNRVYLITESSGMWEWDQLTNTWTQKANFPLGFRLNGVAFAIGNKGYFGLGSDQNAVQKDFWEWDQATDTWTRKADFPYLRGAGCYFICGNKCYVGLISMYDSTKINKFWNWDPMTDTWTQSDSFPAINDQWAVGLSNGNKAYLAFTSMSTNSMWEFNPFGTSAMPIEAKEINLKVFPNPTAGSITLSLTSQSNLPLHLCLKNSLGQVVYTEKIEGFSGECTKTISLQDHAKGVYLLELVGEKECFTQRVIVE